MKREDASEKRGTNCSWWIKKALTGIAPSNIIRTNTGYKIRLGTDWPSMLNSLPILGNILIVTGNRTAVLGNTSVYPLLEYHEHRGSSMDGRFDFEFLPWGKAFATVQERRGKAAFHVEFHDYAGEVMHRLCLTDASHWEPLIEWTQCHQGEEKSAAGRMELPPWRWRTVQQRHWFDYDEVTVVAEEALPCLLQAAMEKEQTINVVAGNEGAVQSAEFIPKTIHPHAEWTFASDDMTGLHFQMAAIDDVIIHDVQCPYHKTRISSLKCFDESGNLVLAITAPAGMRNERWNDFLHQNTGI